MRLRYLIIHCTATPEGREVSAEEIRRWHTSAPPTGRGWKQVGYTDMIHLDGRVERLVNNNEDANVDSWEVTNGAVGYNKCSRHIVYVGGMAADGKTAKDTRTTAQRAALAAYCREFIASHPEVKVIGHRDINKTKQCPCFDVEKFLKNEHIK